MNENEMWTLFGHIDTKEIITNIFSQGIETIIITRGKASAEIFLNGSDNFKVNALEVSAVNVVDCGDAFGASFFLKYIQTNNPLDSLIFANTAAGLTTTYKSLNEYERLKDDIARELN